jgi:hypothetical protein
VSSNRGMQSMNKTDAREERIRNAALSEEEIEAFQKHVTEILEDTVFKVSHRSGKFLRYIVDQAIAGHFESLKERVIGFELFGRSPSYDTGEDAIVRVTASDVRRRLVQHYGRNGAMSRFRISLPVGSYIPEITRFEEAGQPRLLEVNEEFVNAPLDLAARDSTAPKPELAVTPVPVPVPFQEAVHVKSHSRSLWLSLGVLIVGLILTALSIYWSRSSLTEAAHTQGLPWSTFLNAPFTTKLITSDPDIAQIQELTGGQISVSDYANHNYFSGPNKLTPEEAHFYRFSLRGDKASSVDTPIAVYIGELFQANAKRIHVRSARSTQLPDLKTDENFIFLGNPRSNPWVALFSDQLDFRFVFDKSSGLEVVHNDHPRSNELTEYVPTASDGATGESFAIIGFVRNPDQHGHVLLLAGADAEGTAAAGKFVTNVPLLSSTLRGCGIDPFGPLQHFELLLHLNTLAGSPNNINMVACHILQSASGQKP